MTLQAVWDIIVGLKEEFGIGLIAIIVLMSIIQISKININPWDWFFGLIGKKLNKELLNKVEEIDNKLDSHIKEDQKEKLEGMRRDILEFANSCMNGRRHTQEQFTFVIKKCDEYEKYIEDNHIKNGEISSAIEEIRRLNTKCRQKNSYLKPGEEFE